jgi:hypothetical protein
MKKFIIMIVMLGFFSVNGIEYSHKTAIGQAVIGIAQLGSEGV